MLNSSTLSGLDMTGWENILFENRNKKYGAFELRKKSTKYLATGLVLSLLLIFVSSAALFIIFNSELFFPQKLPKTISIEAMQMADLDDFRFPDPPPPSPKTSQDLSKALLVDSTFEEKKRLIALMLVKAPDLKATVCMFMSISSRFL
ncbi:MAG TPA: hypothetical protein VIH57_23645 [Bacteroidales bacterium]